MKHILCLSLILLLVSTTRLGAADDAPGPLAAPLKSFAPLVGKTWKGEFPKSTPQKPLFDVSRWERALNGTAVRILHSVNDGAYGGESLIFWDDKKNSLVYWYFTTAGFHTEGTMRFEKGEWLGHETVMGRSGGITEVKSTSKLLDDGRLYVKSEYLTDGKWEPGREIRYKETPEAKVVFK
jgi:hypothetical protein